MTKHDYRIVFPGDPECGRPDPTRDWHYAIGFAAILVFFFALIVAGLTPSPLAIGLAVAAFITITVAHITQPLDPRYP